MFNLKFQNSVGDREVKFVDTRVRNGFSHNFGSAQLHTCLCLMNDSSDFAE